MTEKFNINDFKKRLNIYDNSNKDNKIALYRHTANHSMLPYFTKNCSDKFEQSLYIAHLKETIKMSSELIRLLRLFENERLSPVCIKGAALSLLLYGSVTKRQYSDIDIYISYDELKRANRILHDLEYKNYMKIPNQYRDIWYAKNKDISMKNINMGITVELHWRLFDKDFPIKISHNTITNNIITLELSGYELKTFNPELYLLYLSIHGAKHFWNRMGWIQDIDTLIRDTKCDINKSLSLTSDKSAKAMIILALYISKNIFNTPVSDELINYINRKKLIRFEKFIYKNWQSKQNQFIKCCEMVMFLETFQQKISYIFYIIFKPTPNEYNWIHLPLSLRYLYYILRPVRLIFKYLKNSSSFFFK